MQPSEAFVGTKRFVVEGRLGAGGMGVVHRVRDLERGEVVALKTMVRLDPEALLRFKREFRALADISHPNVVQLYELFSDEERWFFTMELVDGVDLLTWIRSSLSMPPPSSAHANEAARAAASTMLAPGSLRPAHPVAASAVVLANGERRRPFAVRDVTRLREALRQLAAGLAAIHAAGKLHRDVKPSNVLVTRGGRVVLLDFGVASDFKRGRAGKVADEPLAGTPAYMAPEQAALAGATPASDWYAVGVILYEALTGRLPFDGAPLSIILAKQHEDPPAPTEIVDGLPDDLAELAVDLLSRDPKERPTGDQVIQRLAGRQSSSVSRSTEIPFVGRRTELADLRSAFEASSSSLALVMLHGRSGMGKSALAARFLGELAAQPDVLVLSGRCYEREAVPFKAIDPVVDELQRWLARLPEGDAHAFLPTDLSALARLFPVLGNLDGTTADVRRDATELEAGGPQELRRRAFAALRELLDRIAERYRLVVHIDDLQWCDGDSIQLLEALFAPPSPPWLFVCAYRAELAEESVALHELRQAVERLGAQCTLREVEVTELSDREAHELARALVATGEIEIAQLLHAEARGNPLFLAELARWARERRGTAGASAGISLDQVILERVAGLPDDARALLQTLSVARGPLPHAVAARAAKLDPRARTPALVLRGARLVVTRGLGDDDPIEVVHDRVRETVAESLGDDGRRARHAGIAAALARDERSDPETVFEHFRSAEDHESAKRWAMPAAEAADRALAFLQAASLYRAALDLAAAPADVLHRRIGEALANAGRLGEAADAYLAGARHGKPRERLELRRLAAEYYLKSGREVRGIEVLRSVLEDVGLGYPQSAERAVASILWHEASLRISPLRRRLRSAQSVRGDDLTRIDVAFVAATGLALHDPIRGADFATRGLALALEAGEPLRICRALAVAAPNTAARGEPGRARAEELVREAERIAKQVDEPHALALALLAAGTVHFFLGEWRSARSKLERADKLLRERCRAVAFETANAQCWACNVLILSGELAEASRRVPALMDVARAREDRFAAMHLVYPMSISRIVANDVEGARAVTAAAALSGQAVLNAGHWGAFISTCSVDRYRGDGASAWRRVVTDWPAFERSPLTRSTMVRVFSAYERGLSAIAAASVGHDRARALRAASGWAKELMKEKLRYAAALGHLLRAGVQASRRDESAAMTELESAIPRLDDADLGYLAACARYRKGELLGGSTGRELVERSRSFFEAQGVVDVERCLAMSAPGFKR